MISLSGFRLLSKCLSPTFPLSSFFTLISTAVVSLLFHSVDLKDISLTHTYSLLLNTVAHVVLISLWLLLFPCLLQTLVNTSWPKLSTGPNLSPGARLRSLLTLTLFELDPGDQIAPNITCYFCTVAVDRTLGLQLSGMLVERLSLSERPAAIEFRENWVTNSLHMTR